MSPLMLHFRLESSFRSFSRPVLHAAARVVQEMGKSRAAAFAVGLQDIDESVNINSYSEINSVGSDMNENPFSSAGKVLPYLLLSHHPPPNPFFSLWFPLIHIYCLQIVTSIFVSNEVVLGLITFILSIRSTSHLSRQFFPIIVCCYSLNGCYQLCLRKITVLNILI